MKNATTTLIINPSGTLHCIYQESLNLHAIGPLTIRRASTVEPDADGRWRVDLSPVGGPAHLGTFARRSDALHAEVVWLEDRLPTLRLP